MIFKDHNINQGLAESYYLESLLFSKSEVIEEIALKELSYKKRSMTLAHGQEG